MSERTIFEAARHGDCTRLQQLLDDGKDLDVRDSNGRTALSWAAEGENMEVVRWLLAKKVDVNVKDSKGRTALFWAVKERGRAIGAVKERRRATGPFRAAGAGFGSRVEPADETVGELLLRDNRTIVDSTDNDGRTALLWAVEKGDLVIVEELLKREDVNVNIKDNNGRTALSRAAEGENMEVVRWLLAKKVDVNAKDSKGRTALFWAVKETGRATWSFRAAGAGFGSGVEPAAKTVGKLLLRDSRTIVDSTDNDGRTALLWAVEKGDLVMVGELLKREDVNVNIKDNNGRTALLWAVEKGDLVMVEELLKREDVNVNIKDNNGRTALFWAVKETGRATWSFRAAGAGFGSGVEPAARTVGELLLRDSRTIVDSTDNDGRTALLWAVEKGDLVMVGELLKREDVNVNIRDNNGRTALSRAAGKGNVEVVRQLLGKEGVNLDITDNNGRTALSWAAQKGNVEVVRQLLGKESVTLNIRDNEGRTVLLRAIEKGHQAMVEELLKRDDVDVNIRGNNGQTALSLVAEKGDVEVLQQLLDKKDIGLNTKDENGRTALSLAAEKGNVEVVRRLLAKGGIDVNSKDSSGRTALSWAAEKGQAVVVELMLRNDRIEPDSIDDSNQTPLWRALTNGHETMVNLLANRDRASLLIAIRNEERQFIELLLKASVGIKGIEAKSWRGVYGPLPQDIVVLSEEEGQRKSVRRLTAANVRGEIARVSAGTRAERSLFLFSEFSPWQDESIPGWSSNRTNLDCQMSFSKQNDELGICFCVAARFPNRQEPCAIAWTVIQPTNRSDGPWKSRNHFSMLPNGWIPDDGVDFFKQFICHLRERWYTECDLVEKDLTTRRNSQFDAQGRSPELIRQLAKDAQMLAHHHTVLQFQITKAKEIAKEVQSYHQISAQDELQNAVVDFADKVNDRIKQLDQTLRDILQFEFAWVSINEAHRSTSVATSMKRLSWITFIFLPAMFASSLFGMNVDLLKDNPDWRWYVLLGGTLLVITFGAWLVFKFNPNIELWFEGEVERLMGRKANPGDTERG